MSKEVKNRNKELEEMKREYQNVEADGAVREALEQRMRQAKKDKARMRRSRMRKLGISAAAVLCVLVILPNSSAGIANAMGRLPVVGGLFRVVTFRDYHTEDEHYYAEVAVPQIDSESDMGAQADLQTEADTTAVREDGQETEEQNPDEADAEGGTEMQAEDDRTATDVVNKSVEEYTNELIARFEQEVSDIGEGYQGLDVDYEVLTDTDSWFTLRLNVVETAASGYEYAKYYHINKALDQVVTLPDLFEEDSDYVTRISDYIAGEMRRRMQEDDSLSYFIDSEEAFADDDFKQIKEEQNFYFDQDGQLVIAFDEYEVAPGYMGTVEFKIPDEIISDILVLRP
ncbi:MAG: DUF3298 domain-containing protein [Lachnospiraceae bacterium]|nr:DUF3298 domain-containing protein [Lachnospiraceae bacterium]